MSPQKKNISHFLIRPRRLSRSALDLHLIKLHSIVMSNDVRDPTISAQHNSASGRILSWQLFTPPRQDLNSHHWYTAAPITWPYIQHTSLLGHILGALVISSRPWYRPRGTISLGRYQLRADDKGNMKKAMY